MSNAADSVANLVGYIYGICIEKKIAENPQLPIGKINSEQFLKGVAMALSADNESESALLGIVAGMEIRKNLNSIEKETKLKCPDKQTLTGFCQGFLKKDSLSEVDAEELLNKILLEHYSE